jgi:hypothetical protein
VTGNFREGSATVGGGLSIGEQLSAGGSGQATFDKGVATIGVSGDVAALIGCEVDVSVSVDTNTIVKDSLVVANETKHVVNDVVNVSKSTGNAVKNCANKTGKSVKKAFKIK